MIGVALVAAVSILAPAASAKTSAALATATTGQSSFATGFVDERFYSGNRSVRIQAFGRAASLGSTFVRLTVSWAAVAPTHPAKDFNAADPGDPGYSWSALDQEVADASAARQNVLLQLVYAPTWAEERPPTRALHNVWRPDPQALGAFAHAIAARYSGTFPDPSRPNVALPRVSLFQVWNEPNLSKYLEPQWGRTSRGSFVPLSPSFYRQMVNAVYVNVKSVQPGATVILAGQAPYGELAGGAGMAPVLFLRNLLCLRGSRLRPRRCPNPTHFDAFDHHPYASTPTAHASAPEDVALTDLGRLSRIVNVAVRTGRALPHGPKPMWVTEWGFDSSPPEHGHLSLAVQAHYLSLGSYELWRQRVRYASWFDLFDNPQAEAGFRGQGVYFSDGRAKPDAAAYAFPFVALPRRDGQIIIWGLSREQGVVTIERRSNRGWHRVAQVRSNAAGIFYARRRLGSHLVLRATINTRTSPTWTTG